MITDLNDNEMKLLIQKAFKDEINEIINVKTILLNMKFFNVEYIGKNKYQMSKNNQLTEYQLSDLRTAGFTITNIFPRENNQGAQLTIELSYAKPKGSKTIG